MNQDSNQKINKSSNNLGNPDSNERILDIRNDGKNFSEVPKKMIIPPSKSKEEYNQINILERDEIIKVPHRFNIMMLLYNHDTIGFSVLKKILKLTPGNLDHHLKKMKELGWIKDRTVFSYRPLTIITITDKGRFSFRKYVEELQSLLNNIDLSN